MTRQEKIQFIEKEIGKDAHIGHILRRFDKHATEFQCVKGDEGSPRIIISTWREDFREPLSLQKVRVINYFYKLLNE